MSKKNSPIRFGSDNSFDNSAFGNSNIVQGDYGNLSINQNTNIKRYKGFKENVSILSRVSPIFIRKLGKQKVGILGFISLFSSIITIYAWASAVNYNDTSSVHKIVTANLNFITFSGIILFLFSVLCFGIYSYHRDTKCTNCNREFACKECEDPDIEVVPTAEGYIKITDRHYECIFCGNKFSNRSREEIIKSNSNFK